MKRLSKVLTLAASLVLMAVLRGDTFAQQPASCDGIVHDLKSAIETCDLINKGWACYGNDAIEAAPPEVTFYIPGDRRPLSDLTSIETIPTSGAALMYFQTVGSANPVTVILYGGAQQSPEDNGRVFVLSSSNNRPICEDSPPGMVAFTKSGKRGTITVNGVEVELKSAALFAMTDPDTMVIANIEGTVTATAAGEPQEIKPGWQVAATGIGDGQPAFTGEPEPSPYALSDIAKFLADNLGQVYDPNTDPKPPILACGGEIAVGQTISDEIYAEGQECLYKFCLAKASPVTIRVDAADDQLDPYLDLLSTDSSLITANNDVSSTNANSLICNQPLQRPGCYTVVVSSNRHQSKGPFRLTLDGSTACSSPSCSCTVTVEGGVNLRSGPGTQPVRRILPQGSTVDPIACTENHDWYYVSAARLGVSGWIRANPDYVECEPCNLCVTPAPGIGVSVNHEVESPGMVTFNVNVQNTGQAPLVLKSLSNTLTGRKTKYVPKSDTCPLLIGEPLAVGETKKCKVTVDSDPCGDSLTDLTTASAVDPCGAIVGPESVRTTVETAGEPPEIEAFLEPSEYHIKGPCGTADFKLSVANKSVEPLEFTSITTSLNGAQTMQITEGGRQCPVGERLYGRQTFVGCPLQISACSPPEKAIVWVMVGARSISCEGTAKATASAKIIIDGPEPTVCPKCGPFDGP